MGHSSDSQTIRERFDSQWPIEQPAIPYTFADADFTPTEGQPWVRLTILPGEQTQVSMGQLRRFRRIGVVSVNILTPAGSGDGLAKDLADSVAAIFQGRTINGVIFRGTGLARAGPDGAWSVYNATTPYQADDLI